MIPSFLALLHTYLKGTKFNKQQHYIQDYPPSPMTLCSLVRASIHLPIQLQSYCFLGSPAAWVLQPPSTCPCIHILTYCNHQDKWKYYLTCYQKELIGVPSPIGVLVDIHTWSNKEQPKAVREDKPPQYHRCFQRTTFIPV